MALTVPKAPLSAGRAAELHFQADPTGDAVARLGMTMLQVGERLAAEHEARGLGRARVEAARRLNDIQLQGQQIGSPDELDAWAPQQIGAARQHIIDNAPAGIRDQVGQMFDEQATPHMARLGGRGLELRQSEELANLSAMSDEVVRTVAIADPQTQAEARAQFDGMLDSAVARGVMTPVDAERQRRAMGGRMEDGRATRLLSEDPDALVAAIDSGEFQVLGGEQAQGWRARAVTASAANAARAEAEARRARDAEIGAAKDFLSNGTAVMRRGAAFTGAMDAAGLMQDPQIAALPEAREFVATWQLMQDKPGLAVMPIEDKRAYLAALKAQPADRPFEIDRIDAMEKMIAADEKGFRDDPLTYAEGIGLRPAPALPDPAASSPQEIGAALQERRNHARSLVSQGYADKLTLFTPEEREAWGNVAGPAASPADRAKLAASFVDALGDDAETALAELTNDPVLPFVGGAMQFGLSGQTARQVFEGRRIIDDQQVRMPDLPHRRQAFFTEFEGLFSDGTDPDWGDQSAVLAQVTKAADGLYAYRMRGQLAEGDDAEGRLDADAYLQAVHEVMGGTGKYNDSAWFSKDPPRGGVQKINDWLTILPPGVSGSDVQKRLEHLGKGGGLLGWNGLSATGNLPSLGGELPDASTMRQIHLRAISPDGYVLITRQGTVVTGDDGGPYILRMSALMSVSP